MFHTAVRLLARQWVSRPAPRGHGPRTTVLSVELLEGRVMPHQGELAKWTFGDTVLNDYVLTSYSDTESDIGHVGDRQPTIRLEVGDRYTVFITDPVNHPLQLIAKGRDAFDDVVLLAQKTTNPIARPDPAIPRPFEDDPEVGFESELGGQTVSFTLTQRLADALFDPAAGRTPGYRCGNAFHRNFQRGDLVLAAGTPPPKGYPDDAGNDPVDAAQFDLAPDGAGARVGVIDRAGDVDVFRVVAPVTGLMAVDQRATGGGRLDSVLIAYDSAGRALALNAVGPAGGADARVRFGVVAGRTYFVQASGFGDTTGGYALDVSTTPAPAPPAPGAVFVPLDEAGAGWAAGEVREAGEEQSYYFVAPVTGRMTITQAATGGQLDSLLSVYHGADVLVVADDGGGGLDSLARVDVVAGQTYLLRATGRTYVTLADGVRVVDEELSTGPYRLSLTTDDFGGGFDDAHTVPLDAAGSGSVAAGIEVTGDADTFRVTAPATGRLSVALLVAPGGMLAGSLSGFDGAGAALAPAGGRLDFDVEAGRQYFVRVTGAGAGRYTVYFGVDDAGDTDAGARPVGFDGFGFAGVAGRVELPGDVDVYRFVAPVSGDMVATQVAAGGTGLDTAVAVFDETGARLAENDDTATSRNSQARFRVTAGGTYFVRAAAAGPDTGQYYLTLAADDVPDTFAAAESLGLTADGVGGRTGGIDFAGDVDLFRFVPPRTGPLTLTLGPAPDGRGGGGGVFDGTLQVYDASGSPVAGDDDGGGGYASLVRVGVSAGQVYYVAVRGFSRGTGAYQLFVGDDHGNTPQTASDLAPDAAGGGRQSGRIEQAGDTDAVRFVAPLSGQLAVVVSRGPGSQLNSALAVSDGARTLAARSDPGGTTGYSRVDVTVTAGGTYYVLVSSLDNSAGAFDLTVGADGTADEFAGARPVEVDPAAGLVRSGEAIDVPFDADVFRFVAPASGAVGVSLSTAPGSDLRTSLAAYAPGAGGPEEVASNFDQNGVGYSRVQFPVRAGETYYVRAAGRGTSTGRYNLGVTFLASTGGLVTTPVSTAAGPAGPAVSAADLVRALLAPGGRVEVAWDSVRYTGADRASGLFAGGAGVVGFDGGVILTTGAAANVVGPNFSDGTAGANDDQPGDPDLDGLVPGGTRDAAVLSFDFVPSVNVVELRYVFGSTEFAQYSGTVFDDVFGAFVNGVDYARVPGTGTPAPGTGDVVSVGTINARVHSSLFVDNSVPRGETFAPLNTQLNGLTRELVVRAPVRPGEVNHISLAVADLTDPRYDSAVFLRGGSFRSTREVLSAAAGGRELGEFSRTVAQVGGAGLTAEQINRVIQKAVLAGVISDRELLGDFLVIPIDPVDFTLTDPQGQQTTETAAGLSGGGGAANPFFAVDGANRLLILPNAVAGLYRMQLVGVGSGEFSLGASFVTSLGKVTSVFVQGQVRGPGPEVVLDFRVLDGRVESQTVVAGVAAGTPTAPPAPPVTPGAPGGGAAASGATSLLTLVALLLDGPRQSPLGVGSESARGALVSPEPAGLAASRAGDLPPTPVPVGVYGDDRSAAESLLAAVVELGGLARSVPDALGLGWVGTVFEMLWELAGPAGPEADGETAPPSDEAAEPAGQEPATTLPASRPSHGQLAPERIRIASRLPLVLPARVDEPPPPPSGQGVLPCGEGGGSDASDAGPEATVSEDQASPDGQGTGWLWGVGMLVGWVVLAPRLYRPLGSARSEYRRTLNGQASDLFG